MPRLFLQVPYSHKDKARKKGARWDPNGKRWFVPDGLDSLPFIEWIPELTEHQKFSVYSEYYFIAENKRRCWKCEKEIKLYAFFLPRGHKVLKYIEVDIDEWEDDPVNLWRWDDFYEGMLLYDGDGTAFLWGKNSCLTPVSRITELTPSALRNMQAFSSAYRASYSKTAQNSYYANHCPYCNSLQGDFMIYSEPGGAFCPVTAEQASNIRLHKINEAAFFNGDAAYTTCDFAEYMTSVNSD
ncbi:DUF5710 domain-containing protein [Cedecea sp. NFIX57]|uniref:DUF5710 domain-containing protein n=1 Tax=Cedecea sp. NFIX57 TaxID=1566286 RepID=UPI000A0B876D|nr:DUF5710 domain-containing protein [Cedecea sp. NFIX57]SMG61640.1 hypothetical protein SAMN03159353_105110 [Cedecea sp. NFIX57]